MLLKVTLLFLITAIIQRARAITEPCEISDTKCIRSVLSLNSNCDTTVWGSVPNKVRYVNTQYEVPNFNTTFYEQYATIGNLDKCAVSAFLFNYNTNRAVLAITCPNLYIEAFRAVVYHAPLAEDLLFFFQVNETYPPIIFTIDMPHADDLNICNTYVFPYIEGRPKFKIQPYGPGARQFVKEDYNNILAQSNIYVQEEFSQRGGTLFRLWVNSLLCNFDNFCTED